MTTLLPGPPLPGFHGLFEEDFGDPSTDPVSLTVTPCRVGESTLPFRCPRCRIPSDALACPVARERYHDPRPGRGNYFCPSCGLRFRLRLPGEPLPAGAEVAPAIVEREDGEAAWQDSGGGGILQTILGLLAPTQAESVGATVRQKLVDIYDAPVYVIVNPKRALSTRFENPWKATISGGRRRTPYLGDAKLAGYSYPTRVTVETAEGQTRTFTRLEFCTVHARRMRLNVPERLAGNGYAILARW